MNYFIRVITLVIALGVTSCTVTPDRVKSGSASYDGGEANSGILNLDPKGAVVTPKFVARYQALLERYRKAFVPSVEPEDGVVRQVDGTYFITTKCWSG